MDPPRPVELAERIVNDVAGGVRPDLTRLAAQVAERLLEPDVELVWERAERIATDALTELWDDQLAEPCARSVADAHQLALVQAQRCLEAARDLEENGVGSWIAGAVLHRLAFDVAWDAVTEDGHELAEEGCPSADHG
jgi:hypothetical protein